jgi:hypothetical protein
MNTKKILLPFYFGSVSEEERLQVERNLLTDSETLTDYLDLKRELEAASLSMAAPSNGLWEKLKPGTEKQKCVYLSLSLGAAVAAGLAIILVLQSRPKPTELIQPPVSKVLFDSSSELPASSGVL